MILCYTLFGMLSYGTNDLFYLTFKVIKSYMKNHLFIIFGNPQTIICDPLPG